MRWSYQIKPVGRTFLNSDRWQWILPEAKCLHLIQVCLYAPKMIYKCSHFFLHQLRFKRPYLPCAAVLVPGRQVLPCMWLLLFCEEVSLSQPAVIFNLAMICWAVSDWISWCSSDRISDLRGWQRAGLPAVVTSYYRQQNHEAPG